jgi:hypothetical protein
MRFSFPNIILRVEGLAVFIAALFFYTRMGGSWGLFALLILAPDLGMLGYLINSKVGSVTYNLLHWYLGSAILLTCYFISKSEIALCLHVALVWAAHIGIDRFLGFGLKYPTGFKDTHLQKV